MPGARRRPPLVGRDGELGELRAALARAASGAGGVTLVRGETGIGKSRLVDELAVGSAATHVVLTGRAVEGGGAFRPIADALVGALRAGHDVAPSALGAYAAPLSRLLPDWQKAGGAAAAEARSPTATRSG